MNQLPSAKADINNIRTWVKYSKKLCDHCMALCCTLPVEVKALDLIRLQLMDKFELEYNPRVIAKRLTKPRWLRVSLFQKQASWYSCSTARYLPKPPPQRSVLRVLPFCGEGQAVSDMVATPVLGQQGLAFGPDVKTEIADKVGADKQCFHEYRSR